MEKKNEMVEVEKVNIKEVVFTNLQYLTLVALIVGQCVVGIDFLIGQCVYLFANTLAVARNYALHRPAADKVKDWSCFAITVGLIGIKLLNGLV